MNSVKQPDWPQLLLDRQEWRQAGLKVVWTNGCFDLFHVGHLRSLKLARCLGDRLVVGINSDTSVRQLKGKHRPILSQQDRAELLASLECVDRVVVFEDATPEVAINRLQPDIHCKGGEYGPDKGKVMPEAAIVEKYGGKVCFLPMVAGVSTTDIIKRIHCLKPGEA